MAVSYTDLDVYKRQILTRAEADEQAARKVEEAETASSAPSESTPSERALDEQADLDEAYEQWDSTHTVSGEPDVYKRQRDSRSEACARSPCR